MKFAIMIVAAVLLLLSCESDFVKGADKVCEGLCLSQEAKTEALAQCDRFNKPEDASSCRLAIQVTCAGCIAL